MEEPDEGALAPPGADEGAEKGEALPVDEDGEEKGDVFAPVVDDCGAKGELDGEVPGAVFGLVWVVAGFCDPVPSPGL